MPNFLAQCRVAVFINAMSRVGGASVAAVAEQLATLGVRPVGTEVVTVGERFVDQFRALLDSNPDVLLVGGGDGTLCFACSELASRSIALGVLPLGTGNSLARELGIPLGLSDALRALADAQLRQIDLGEVIVDGQRRTFATVATIGLTGSIVENLTRESRERLGLLSYGPAAFAAFQTAKPIRLRIKTPSATRLVRVAQWVVSNGRLHAGVIPITEGASIDDGLLSAYAVEGRSKLDWVLYAARLLTPVKRIPNLWEMEEPWIEVHADKPVAIVLDGEPILGTKFLFRSLPRVLRVLSPSLQSAY